MALRAGIKGIIFDLDHTLYRAPDDEHAIVCDASAATALELGFGGTREQAIGVISRAWHEHGDDGGIVLSRDHGIDRAAYMKRRHEIMLPEFLRFLKPDPELVAAFNRLAARHEVAILTHATQRWAEALTPHLGYATAMPPGRIFGLDSPSIAFNKKSDGPEAYLAVVEEMGLKPHEVATADDNVFNLAQAFRAGLQALHIRWDAPPSIPPAHVDRQVRTIAHIY